MKTTNTNFLIKLIILIFITFPINNTLLKLTETKNQDTNSPLITDKNITNNQMKSTKKIEDNKEDKINEDKYEKVEIMKKPNIPTKTPLYVNPPKNNDMKSPTLIQTKETQILSPGLTESPNFLSTVIRSAPTSVRSSVVRQGDGSLTFDLEAVSKKNYIYLFKERKKYLT